MYPVERGCQEKSLFIFICLGNLDNVIAIFTDAIAIRSWDKVAKVVGVPTRATATRIIEPVSFSWYHLNSIRSGYTIMYPVQAILSNIICYFLGHKMTENKEPREYGAEMLYPP